MFSSKNLHKALTRSTYSIYPLLAELRLGPNSILNTCLFPLCLYFFLSPLLPFIALFSFICFIFYNLTDLKKQKRCSRRPNLSTENDKFGDEGQERQVGKEGRERGRFEFRLSHLRSRFSGFSHS